MSKKEKMANISKIEERQGLQKQVNVVLCVFISVFCVLFAICGLVAILDRVYWGIIFIVAVFILISSLYALFSCTL